MQPWKRIEPTIKTKIDYQTVIIKTYELPDGELASRATFYPEETHCAAVIALTKDKNVIVCQQYRPGPDRVMIELPGGGVELGENPEAAARRELLEETGYSAKNMVLLGNFHRDAYVNGTWHYYIATDCRLTHDQALDQEEFINVELMTIDAFLANAKKGNMTDPFAVLAGYDQLKELQKKEIS